MHKLVNIPLTETGSIYLVRTLIRLVIPCYGSRDKRSCLGQTISVRCLFTGLGIGYIRCYYYSYMFSTPYVHLVICVLINFCVYPFL